MSDFTTAIQIAAQAHEGQVDKGGSPYMLHTLHVASHFLGELASIAILKDVIKDSPLTLEGLAAYGFSDRVLDVVETLTRRSGEGWEVYIHRVSKCQDAVAVTLRTLEHAMDLARLPFLEDQTWPRLLRYHTAYRLLAKLEL